MIVVSLDEGGRFERPDDFRCMVIGGVVFECRKDSDIPQELNCLRDFFQTVCKEQGGEFPSDLHYNRAEGKVINAGSANRVKTALIAELSDYLNGKGRWTKARPDRFRYYLYCMAGDKNGMRDGTGGNLSDDNYASNRYEHMVYRTVENMLFFNPYFCTETNVRLDLATRVSYTGNDPVLRKEYSKLGYAARKASDGTFDPDKVVVTDEASFRTCLTAAVSNNDRGDIDFDLNVKSISYQNYYTDQGFLYLADTLCTVYQNLTGSCGTAGSALRALYDGLQKFSATDRILLWAYLPTDRIWRNAWKNYIGGHWFETIKLMYEIRSARSTGCDVYGAIWLAALERMLKTTADPDALREALLKLDSYMDESGKLDNELARYLAECLQTVYELLEDPAKKEKLQFLLYKSLIAVYNHSGNYKKADEAYEKCLKAINYIPVEELLGIQLRRAVSIQDSGKTRDAFALADSIVKHQELIIEIKEDINPGTKFRHDSYGRALSQLGQEYATMGQYTEAAERFRTALDHFEYLSDDYRKTATYLLHVYIESSQQTAYEELSAAFFGDTELKKQFDNAVNGKCGRIDFAVYAFMKALWCFYRDSIPSKELKQIVEKIRTMRKEKNSHHPWELILKYCALLWQYRFEENDHTESGKLMLDAEASVENQDDGILVDIMREARIQYQAAIDGNPDMNVCKLQFIYR